MLRADRDFCTLRMCDSDSAPRATTVRACAGVSWCRQIPETHTGRVWEATHLGPIPCSHGRQLLRPQRDVWPSTPSMAPIKPAINLNPLHPPSPKPPSTSQPPHARDNSSSDDTTRPPHPQKELASNLHRMPTPQQISLPQTLRISQASPQYPHLISTRA